MNDTIDTFWSDYTTFNYNNCPFGGDDFIWSSKDINEINICIWNQKYSLSCAKVLGFVACRFTSKIISIGAAERSWGDVKKIRSEKWYGISSDVSEKQSIVYLSDCNESGSI